MGFSAVSLRRIALGTIGCLAALALLSAEPGFSEVASYETTTEQLSKQLKVIQEEAGKTEGYDVVFRRDPMHPLVDAQGQPVTTAGWHGGLSVQGIIWSTERPLAVVDGELFAPGDMVGPYLLTEILGDGVMVRRGEEQLFIPLDRGFEPPAAEPVAATAPQPQQPASQPAAETASPAAPPQREVSISSEGEPVLTPAPAIPPTTLPASHPSAIPASTPAASPEREVSISSEGEPVLTPAEPKPPQSFSDQ